MCHRQEKKLQQRPAPAAKPDTKDAAAAKSPGITQPHNAKKEALGPNTKR